MGVLWRRLLPLRTLPFQCHAESQRWIRKRKCFPALQRGSPRMLKGDRHLSAITLRSIGNGSTTGFGARWGTTRLGIQLVGSPIFTRGSLVISTQRKNGNGFVLRHMTDNPVNDAMGNVEAFERMLRGER